MKRFSGLRYGVDFFSGVLVGAVIGYCLDVFFNTKPWLLCTFLVLGFAAGINNVVKVMKKMREDHD